MTLRVFDELASARRKPETSVMRALCIVLDSVGCGHAPDAEAFGDLGANTLGHLFERVPGFALPSLAALGLHEVLRSLDPDFPLPSPPLLSGASYGHLTEQSCGKDTTTGHWEIMGAPLEAALATFEKFPPELTDAIEAAGRCKFIGNETASGTEIIDRLGPTHLQTGHPILYTSADSVLQIAAHEDPAVFGLSRLQDLCLCARRILDQHEIRIGRVIARPFVGNSTDGFERTSNRHDYSLKPPPTMLNRLQDHGAHVVGIGKIADIFASSGITSSHTTASNKEGMETIEKLWKSHDGHPTLVFANLVDFDMLFGHRRDPQGYAGALLEFDRWLGGFLADFSPSDLLLITADHGNDPYHQGTDHTRERVPLLALNQSVPRAADFGEVARVLGQFFQLPDFQP